MLSDRLERLRSDDGFSLVETMVGSALGLVFLVAVSIFLVGSMKTSLFTDTQSTTINDVRNAMGQVEKEIRGADSIAWCQPVEDCVPDGKSIEVGAQTPTASFRTVRYSLSGTELRREIFDDVTDTWGLPVTVVTRVANSPSQKIFSCDVQSTLLRVNVDLHIRPTDDSNPLYNVQTSIRPRNYAETANCT